MMHILQYVSAMLGIICFAKQAVYNILTFTLLSDISEWKETAAIMFQLF